jgi:hypothetical protein
MMTCAEVVWLLNSCDDLTTKADDLADLIELGDLFFDDNYNLRATPQGKAKLRVLPRTTD